MTARCNALAHLASRCSLETSPNAAVLTAKRLKGSTTLRSQPTVFVNMVKKDANHFGDVAAAVADLSAHGLHSVPHLPAARFDNLEQVAAVVESLHAAGASSVLALAGNDCDERAKTGAPLTRAEHLFEHLQARRFPKVCVAGYPEGDGWNDDSKEGEDEEKKDVSDKVLLIKVARLLRLGHDVEIVTQFCFDPARLVRWLHATRRRMSLVRAAVECQSGRSPAAVSFRVGMAGPCSAVALQHIARVCNVRPLDHAATNSATTDIDDLLVADDSSQDLQISSKLASLTDSAADLAQFIVDEIKLSPPLPRIPNNSSSSPKQPKSSSPPGPSMFVSSPIDPEHNTIIEPLNECLKVAQYCKHTSSTDLSLHFFPFGGLDRTIDFICRLQNGR